MPGRMILMTCFWVIVALHVTCASVCADDDEPVYELGTVQVMEESNPEQVVMDPGSDIIHVDEYDQPVIPQSIVDIVKDQPIIDFRGTSDLVPNDDTIYMRGFGCDRFVTAMDGLTLRKTGGRKSTHMVDYGTIPPWMVQEIEILPGPHSALYPSKAIGGVLNLKTRGPKRFENFIAEGKAQVSYRSYNTQNHHLEVHGGANGLIYDLGGQMYSTDGYLRNNAADIDTVYGRGGYVFADGGYLTLSTSYTHADRQMPVANDPNDPQSNYDSDYPVVTQGTSGSYDTWDPTADKISKTYSLNAMRPTSIGNLSLVGSYSKETNDRTGSEGQDVAWETKWRQWSAKLMDEIRFSDAQTTTVGVDMAQLFDGYGRIKNMKGGGWYDDHERFRNWAAFAQHKWEIFPGLKLTAGLRYEYLKAFVHNDASNGQVYITGQDAWIERSWDTLLPKSFLTYELDGLASWLRDTSVSLGISRVWRAPDWHGDVNPQGRPAGAWLDPEHGMGYDLVVKRRLFADLQFKADFSFYRIKDFIASNSRFSKYWPKPGNPVPAGQEYKDYKINLDEVQCRGLELSLRGHIFEPLSFYVGYAYVDFENEGGEPAGEMEVSNRAKHRVNAGLEYALLPTTKVLVDYTYQDSQQADIYNYYPSTDTFTYTRKTIDPYHLFDLAVEQTLFTSWKGFTKGKVKLYVNNVFDEEYENQDGYPATDRTFGAALSVSF